MATGDKDRWICIFKNELEALAERLKAVYGVNIDAISNPNVTGIDWKFTPREELNKIFYLAQEMAQELAKGIDYKDLDGI